MRRLGQPDRRGGDGLARDVPHVAAALREAYAHITAGYRMPKRHRITLAPGDSIDARLVEELVTGSHRLVLAALPRRPGGGRRRPRGAAVTRRPGALYEKATVPAGLTSERFSPALISSPRRVSEHQASVWIWAL